MKVQSEPLHIKWRPAQLEEVIGQDAVVKNLNRLFATDRVPHSFLFTGPSGCGKTTVARIVASTLGAQIIEVDAARYSGIDSMRDLLIGAQYSGLGENPRKMYIIDEAHALSKATWQSLLLNIEEPRDHLYWALCTTEAEKVPKTIRTRCHTYDMHPVPWALLSEYLEEICAEEKLKIKKEFIDLAARRAEGSVRQGLVFLSMLDGINDKSEALKQVEDFEAQEEGPIVLARMLVSGRGATWPTALKLLQDLKDTSPETIRLTVINYAATALLNESGEKNAMHLLAVLQAFASINCTASERMAPILLAVGGLLLGE